jgi:hypothetical protein
MGVGMADEKTLDEQVKALDAQGMYVPKTGVGQFVASVGRVFTGLASGLAQGAGLVSEDTIIKRRHYDDVLSKKGGAVVTAGNIVGNVAAVAPAALVTGGSSILVAGALGAAEGAAKGVVESEGESRVENAAWGAATGLALGGAGKFIGGVAKGSIAVASEAAEDGIQVAASKSFGGKVKDVAKSLFDRVNFRSITRRDNLDLGDKIVKLQDNPGPLKRMLAEARAKGFDSDTVDKINRLAEKGKIPQKIADEITEQFNKRFQGTGTKGLYDSWVEFGKASAGTLTADPLGAAWLGTKGSLKLAWETTKLGGKTLGLATNKWVMPFEGLAALYAHEHTDGESTKKIFGGLKSAGETVIDVAPSVLDATATGVKKVAEFANSESGMEIAENIHELATDTKKGIVNLGGKALTEGLRLKKEVLPGFVDTALQEVDPDGKVAKVDKIVGDATGLRPSHMLTGMGRTIEAGKAFIKASTSGGATSTEASTAQPEENKNWSDNLLSGLFGTAAGGAGALDTIKTKLKSTFNAFSDNPLGKMMNDMGAKQLTFAVAASGALLKATNSPLLAFIGFFAALMAFGDDPAPVKTAPKPELAMG